MGEVHLARDTRLGRLVAIKFLLEHSGPAAGRFLAEARTTAQCRHDNIVVIYDLGEFDGFPYMVLEYIQGQSLRDTMNELGKGVQAIAIDIILPVVRALERAHEMGIVHRDLKPENILISDAAQVKVLDFGIAKQASFDNSATSSVAPPVSVRQFDMVMDASALSETFPMLSKASALVLNTPPPSVRVGKPVSSAVTPAAIAATIPAMVEMDATFPAASESTSGAGHRSALAGTMPYMSPEQWLCEGIDARTDIWAAGIILFELLTGTHPLDPISYERIAQVKNLDLPMPSAQERRADTGPFAEIIDRCLKKRKEERFGSAKELVAALERVGAANRALPAHSADENPFAGLSAFQKSDAGRFFGRDHDISAALGKLRSQQFIVIAGPSGAGKSSFVRAGIIPALERDGRNVESYMIRTGRRPIEALADVLASFHDTADIVEDVDPEAIASTLRTQPGLLGAKLRARCRKRGKDHRIVLLVDQLEELFTQGIDAAERMAFCACLEGVADDASSPLRVIATIRADFLDRLAEDRRFWGEVTRGLIFLPPMTRDGLRDALTKPVEAVQYRFEDENLVEEMLNGLEGTTTPLPILQFSATKLWEARDLERHLLTRAAYETLGGVAGALSTHADAVIAGLSLPEQQLARTILMALVTPERSRAIVPIAELLTLAPDHAAVDQVLHRLGDARLLSMDSSDERAGKTVELSHESLIARWGKLRHWLDDDEQDAQFLAQLRNAAQQWEKNGEAQGFLWRDRAAIEAGQWLERRKAERRGKGSLGLAKREERYIEAVVRLAERARTWRRRIVGTIVLSLSVIAVVVSVLAFRAQEQARRADIEKGKAEVQRAEAEAQRAEALVQRAEAERNATRARNAMRVAAARVFHEDPTTALALLREIEPGFVPQGWSELAKRARSFDLASTVLVHDNGVYSARFSPDGQYIVSASKDVSVRVWRADGLGKPLVLRGHTDEVYYAAWSPDGKRIVSASRDKTLRVWNADGSGQPLVLEGHGDRVSSAEFSPDGKRIVSASVDKTVRVWQADGSGIPLVLEGHTSVVISAAFSPDGKRIASGSIDKTVRLWNADGSGKSRIFRGHGTDVYRVAFSPDGNRIASVSDDKTARVWNVDRQGEPLVFRGHTQSLRGVAWSPDGKHIVTTSYDKTVREWDANAAGEPLRVYSHAGEVMSASYSPDNRYIISASFDKTVRIWRTEAQRDAFELRGHTDWIASLAYSPDGEHIVSASVDKTVRIWNADGNGVPLVFRGHSDAINSVAYHPDGKHIASGSVDKTVRVWDVDAPEQRPTVSTFAVAVNMVQYSPDGTRIVAGLADRTLRVWNADGQDEPLVLRGHEDEVLCASFSPDGKHIVTTSIDKTVRVWNADGSGEPLILRGHEDNVGFATYSPDGKRIATTSFDKTVRIWNADGSGSPLILRGHEHRVFWVDWSPDGNRLATASQDATVRVWNRDGAGTPLVLRGALPYNNVDWRPDGKRIIAGSDNNTITIWTDINPIQHADDSRLWTATPWCMPLDFRQQVLAFTDEQSRADLERCEQRVRAARQ